MKVIETKPSIGVMIPNSLNHNAVGIPQRHSCFSLSEVKNALFEAWGESKIMGACFSSEIEDKFAKNPFSKVYDLLVYGYIHRIDRNTATEIVNIILKYMDRRRWGSLFGGTTLKGLNGEPFDALNLDGITKKITGIEMISGDTFYIQAIRLQVNGKWMKHIGRVGLVSDILILKQNEWFNKLDIQHTGGINYIKIHTNLGRSVKAEGKIRHISASQHTQNSQEGDGDESVLIDIRGRCTNEQYRFYINELQFMWG